MTYQIYIYTLTLEEGYYYVGKTIDPDRRFNEHFNDEGAVWTKLHPPVSLIEKESFLVSSLEEEDRWENHQTIKMMKAKGWQMVRGGYWCEVGELETIKKLQHHGYFLDIDMEDISFNKREQYIYLLELENDKYYVGYSRSLKYALKRQEKGIGSNWTRLHKPLRLLKYQEVVFENGIPNLDMANEWVLQCGAEYGYENVRGGDFCLLEPEQHVRLIQSFLQRKPKDATASNLIYSSKLLKEYEANHPAVDYNLPLKENERVIAVYVLALEDDYYHVSCSTDLEALLRKYEKGKYCAWCRLHTPVELLEIIPVICPADHWEVIDELDPVVERYFNTYGAEKVRGGRFVLTDEQLHLKKVFERYKIEEGKYIRYTQKEMRHLKYEHKKLRKANSSEE